jgi:hypothetical protein
VTKDLSACLAWIKGVNVYICTANSMVQHRRSDLPDLFGKGKVAMSVNLRIFSPFKEGADAGVLSSPFLITPVRQKKYNIYKSALQSLWEQADRTLMTAKRIVVIGYSFPKTDVRPLGLLRNVLRKRPAEIDLNVVAPGVDSILERIGGKGLARAKSVRAFDMKFEAYIELLASTICLGSA